MLKHAEHVPSRDFPDFHGVQSPFLEDAEDFLFTAFLRDQQHAFLRFAQHDLVRSHSGFALRNAIKLDFDAHTAAAAHLAGGAGQSGGTHVLNANNGSRLHGFEARLQQEFLEERVAYLNVRTLRFRSLAELLARHRGAVNPVAPGLGAHVDDGIAFSGRTGVEDFILAY